MSYRQHWICLTLVEVTDLLGHRYTGGVKQYMPCRIQPSFLTISCDVKQYIPCMHACRCNGLFHLIGICTCTEDLL